MLDRASGSVCKREPELSQPDHGSSRACKQEAVLSHSNHHCEERRDHCTYDRTDEVHTLTNQLLHAYHCSLKTHHDDQNETRLNTDAVLVEVAPNNGTNLEEQHNPRKEQVKGEQSDPSKTNNTSSQVTQEEQDSVNKAKRRQRGRRRRARKRKAEKVISNRQTTENPQSECTAQGPAESHQKTASATYYAIKNGNYGYSGVHTDWDLCVRYLKGTCGATFKSFSTLEEAFDFAHGDGSPGESAPLKKMKTEGKPQSTNRGTHAPPSQENESQSLEEIESLVDLHRTGRAHSPDGKVTTSHRYVERTPSRRGNRPTRRVRSKHKQKPSGKDPSLKEILPPKDVQPVEQVPASKVVQPAEEVRLQEWKVEPVLLPVDLFSPEDNQVKREQMLIPVEPSGVGH